MGKKAMKLLSALLSIAVLTTLIPSKTMAAAAPPSFTGVYQKDNHVKLEWAVEMADEDIMTQTSFEPSDMLPILAGGGNTSEGNQTILNTNQAVTGSRVLQVTDTVTTSQGNWWWYPETKSTVSGSRFQGVSFPNGSDLSVTFKARSLGGNGWARFDFRGEWLEKGLPFLDNNRQPVYFTNPVNFQTNPKSFEVRLSDGSLPSLNNGQLFVIVTAHNSDYNYGVKWYMWDATSRKMIEDPNNTYVFSTTRPIDGYVFKANTDTFQAGENVLQLHQTNMQAFSDRYLPADNQWHTYSLNTKLDNALYNYATNGIHPIILWSTNGTYQMDDVKFGYATETEVFRDGQSIYRGYLSDYEDTAAIDLAAPNTPNGVNISIGSGRKPLVTWSVPSDNGTTYNYQIKGYPRNAGPTALSPNQPVTVTSGIKGYSVVIDSNPNTMPPDTVTTTGTSYTAQAAATGNFYVHLAAIDQQGNRSNVVHIPYTDTIQPTLQVTADQTDWTKGPVNLTALAMDDETGIKRTQVPGGEWRNQEQVSVSVHQNGTYTFIAEDNAGNQTQKSITVSNLDSQEPTISFTPDSRPWDSQEIVVEIKYEDLLSGVDPNQRLYKVTDSAVPPSNWDNASDSLKTVKIPSEGTWYIHAKVSDRVGNTVQTVTNALQLQKLPETPVLQVNGANHNSAQLEWTLPNGSTLTDGYVYVIQNITTGQSWEIPYPESTFSDVSLSGGKLYQYQIKARNHVGESSFSAIAEVLTLPDVPAEVLVEKDGRHGDRALVTITPVESATSYRIIARDNNSGQIVFNQTVTETVYQPVTNLEPGTMYDISVAALNKTGEGQAAHTGYLTVPAAPGGFSDVQIGEDYIDLRWHTVTSATYYELVRDQDIIHGGPTNTFRDIGLSSGTSYNYQVSAENGTGFGEYSILNNVWTLPAAPSYLESVNPKMDELTIQWPEVRGAEGYVLTVNGMDEIQLPQGTTQYVLTNLPSGATYELSLRSINRSGKGLAVSLITSTIPAAPEEIHVVDIEEQSAVIQFSDVPGATKYRVSVDGKEYDITDHALHVNGLTGGQTYVVTVMAGNASGFSPAQSMTFLTLPYNPNALRALDHTPTSVTLSWDEVQSATSYIILNENREVIAEIKDTEFQVESLTPGTTNIFFVKAVNATGESAAASFEWLTLPDSKGANVHIDEVGIHTALISWTPVPGAIGYKVFDSNEKLIEQTKELKVSIDNLESAAKIEGWVLKPFNETGYAETVKIPAFVTKPSGDFSAKVSETKERQLILEFEHELVHESFVVSSKGKEIYRGEGDVVSINDLIPNTKHTFDLWTENEIGEKSEVKAVDGKTLATSVPPSSGGSDYNPQTSAPPTQPRPEKEVPDIKKPGNKEDPKTIVFKDIDKTFNRDQILELVRRGIIQGVSATESQPNRPIDRIEFLSLIVRALQLEPTDVSEVSFKDIDLNAWYGPEFKAAIGNGIAHGFSASEFRPFNLITREQASKMLANALYSEIIPDGEVSFADSKNISKWAEAEVRALTGNQLVQGYPDGSFRPKAYLTRAESAALIYRMITMK
ncbi:fibronectin type III domain-containing protein [Paenibacillus sp. NPDC093718]|uniref:fibronectin type III domain-containing protein n=1 Tax=Paenibacillus sp. NPDC093718 TaxID=3390601 RepID=UPI003D0718EC